MIFEIREDRIVVLETEGEAAMKLLRQAGFEFTYESFWVPMTEYWLSIDEDAHERDVDNWH